MLWGESGRTKEKDLLAGRLQSHDSRLLRLSEVKDLQAMIQVQVVALDRLRSRLLEDLLCQQSTLL